MKRRETMKIEKAGGGHISLDLIMISYFHLQPTRYI